MTTLAASAAVNIVTNGDFSAGNTGFTSGYTFVSYGTDMHPQGLYTVGPNLRVTEQHTYANGASSIDVPVFRRPTTP